MAIVSAGRLSRVGKLFFVLGLLRGEDGILVCTLWGVFCGMGGENSTESLCLSTPDVFSSWRPS